MKPGRELDVSVAEKVMGWAWSDRFNCFITSSGDPLGYPFNPSTDIAAAWEVVEKLCPQEDEFRLTRFNQQDWECTFHYSEGERALADTAPLAICLAALEAVGGEEAK